YNFFVRRSKSQNADLDDFANDLLALAEHPGFTLRTGECQSAAGASTTLVRGESAREALA
ncbi:MAG: MotA/TolQ/ExbB proton channel family protein, partial [Burkholderiales bacterium]|nr:MotA/TolQ/ExbB proton channel family protein [Burkholderiales bacterium]